MAVLHRLYCNLKHTCVYVSSRDINEILLTGTLSLNSINQSMGTNCAHLVENVHQFCYERYSMSLSDNNKADNI